MKLCRHRLMKEIQTLAFACHETALYLDGHPTDRRAITYFNAQNEKLKEATALYEENFGPLTANSVKYGSSWSWIDGPWPWK